MNMLLLQLYLLLVERMFVTADDRYGATWRYMVRAFTRRATGEVDPVLLLRLALVACEQVRKMAEVAYEMTMEERINAR